MIIKQQIGPSDGNFYALNDAGDSIGELHYQTEENKILIDHTYVNPQLRGQGIAAQLVDAAVAYARMNNFRIVPICSYAKAILRPGSGYSDVI